MWVRLSLTRGRPVSLRDSQAIATADFDRDGIPDLADASVVPESLTILKGSGDGNFAPSFRYAFPDLIPVSLATADFNRDGKQDVVALVEIPMGVTSQGEVQIFLGNGDGTLQTPTSLALAGVNPTFLAVADLNDDGIPDLAATAQGGVWIWLGKGDGTFSEPAIYSIAGATLPSLAIADFNGTGDPISRLPIKAGRISPSSSEEAMVHLAAAT